MRILDGHVAEQDVGAIGHGQQDAQTIRPRHPRRDRAVPDAGFHEREVRALARVAPVIIGRGAAVRNLQIHKPGSAAVEHAGADNGHVFGVVGDNDAHAQAFARLADFTFADAVLFLRAVVGKIGAARNDGPDPTASVMWLKISKVPVTYLPAGRSTVPPPAAGTPEWRD